MVLAQIILAVTLAVEEGISIQTIIMSVLAIAGGISVVGGAGMVVFRVIRPILNVVKRVEELERRSEKDYASILAAKKFDVAVCKALMALLDHNVDGNSTNEMAKARSELSDFLIEARG